MVSARWPPPPDGADYRHNLHHLLKVVRARGIEGVLLMPSAVPLELDLSVNWNGFSVVAMSKSILTPRFHCVVPNHFGGFSYLDESADLVGAAAIDLLGGMMYYHETGIPDHPRTTAIDGALVARGRMRSAAKDSGLASTGGRRKRSRSASNS